MSWRWLGLPTSLRLSSRSPLNSSFLNSSTALPLGSSCAAFGGSIQDGVDDRLVAGAAADVAGDRLHHVGARRSRIAVEQRLRGHQHAGSAEAALGREMLHEGRLQWMQAWAVADAH